MRRESVYFCFASQNVHGPAAAPPLSATALIQRVHGICLVIYYPDLTRIASRLSSRGLRSWRRRRRRRLNAELHSLGKTLSRKKEGRRVRFFARPGGRSSQNITRTQRGDARHISSLGFFLAIGRSRKWMGQSYVMCMAFQLIVMSSAFLSCCAFGPAQSMGGS